MTATRPLTTASAAHDDPGAPPGPVAATVPPFAVIPGSQVRATLEGRERELVRLVEDAYRLHCAGGTVNPPSQFLRFPDRPADRIIALPASIGGSFGVDGLKWISSVPGNVAAGIPRASAVLILNDRATGYPIACIEASIISATRTAALAASAADWLSRGRSRPTRVGFVGTGLIARYVHTFLAGTGWTFDAVAVHDLSPESAAGFRGYLERSDIRGRMTVHDSAERLIRSSDLIVFATVATRPHVTDPAWFEHDPLVLHVSLRDLAPEVILASTNVVDDAEHCLTADTSPHLAEQLTGGRDFLLGTLGDVMAGRATVPDGRPVVFSPFGLGVLDLAVGADVYAEVARAGELPVIDGFFHELSRYGEGAERASRTEAPAGSQP
jgi:ornithine cyclodeaminase